MLLLACGSEHGTTGATGDAAVEAGADGAASSDGSSSGDDGGDPLTDGAAEVGPGGDCVPACGPNEYCFLSYPRADAGDPADARDPFFVGCLPAPAGCGGVATCDCVKNDTYAYCSSAEECIEHQTRITVTCLR